MIPLRKLSKGIQGIVFFITLSLYIYIFIYLFIYI
nr:MAG TPA: hypothetical protein [Caudoviricetes sp.]